MPGDARAVGQSPGPLKQVQDGLVTDHAPSLPPWRAPPNRISGSPAGGTLPCGQSEPYETRPLRVVTGLRAYY
jgi:hypothetical protein